MSDPVENVAEQLQDTSIAPSAASKAVEQNITPWDVEGAVDESGKQQAIDYDKLIQQFGTRKITEETLARFKEVTGHEPHIFLKRGVFFSERDLTKILTDTSRASPSFCTRAEAPRRTVCIWAT